MYINIGTVTVRSFETTKWNPDTKEREDVKPDEREYEIVAIDKHMRNCRVLAICRTLSVYSVEW